MATATVEPVAGATPAETVWDGSLSVTEPRMLDLVDRLTRVALWVAATAAFGSALLLLVLGRDWGWRAWLAAGIPLGVWVVGLRDGKHRAAIQTGACALLLASPLVAGQTGATGFVALNCVAFATIFPAIIAFRAPVAVVTVFGTAALLAVLALLDPPGAVVGAAVVDAVVGVLFCVMLGLGVILTRSQWVPYLAELDDQQRFRRAIEETQRRESERADARAAVERRIHETVLNTLSGLSLGVPEEGRSAAVAACRRDLDQLRSGVRELDASTLRAVIVAAVAVDDADGPSIVTSIDTGIELPPATALSLRDAVVECLRNVRRHASATQVAITATVVQQGLGVTALEVEVRDDGIGIPPSAVERFGIRNTIRAAMERVGGSVALAAAPEGGTTVTLRVPVGSSAETPAIPSVAGLLGVSRLGRVGLLAGVALLLLVTPALAEPIGIAWFAVPAVVVLAIINAAIALNWDTRWRVPLAVAATTLTVATLLVAATSRPDCTVRPQVSWLAGIMCGASAALAFVAPRTQLGRALMIAATTMAGLALVTQLPSACQVGPFISVTTAASYLVGLWLVLQWGDSTFAASRKRAFEQWQRILAARAQLVRSQEVAQGWDQVDDGSRDLLVGVASGALDPTDRAVRSRATAQAALIRSCLGLGQTSSSGIGQLAARLADNGADVGARVDAAMLTAVTRTDLLPLVIRDALDAAVRASVNGLVVLRAAVTDGQEDVVITLSRAAVEAGGLRALDEHIDDCDVLVLDDPDEPDQVRVVVGRPG